MKVAPGANFLCPSLILSSTLPFQVGMFDLKHRDVPCVGVSLGMERLFSIMEAQVAKSNGKTRTTETEVFVASAQKNLIEERMKILAHLWDNDIKVKAVNLPSLHPTLPSSF